MVQLLSCSSNGSVMMACVAGGALWVSKDSAWNFVNLTKYLNKKYSFRIVKD